ncbi:hypothetical protein PV325_003244 [Microctonus aethiopoides]|nr:hypothetical protein PV325_003244 [Microctonus aethiopoides]
MCITPTCLQAAADILENMDPSVNPCDNFFKFTCGQFLNSTFPIPDKKMASLRSDMDEDIVTRLGGLLNSSISENDIELFRQTKQLYRQCLDRKTISEQQDKNILDILNKFGGWPVVMGDTWNSTDIDWTNTPAIFSYAQLLIQPIATTYQDHYPVKNFTNYSDDSVYYNFLVKYAVKLGAEEDRAKKEIMEAIKFENLLELTNLGSNTILENEDLEMKDENDWRNCVRQTADSLPEIVTALYVRNFIRDDEKLEAMNIASNIKNELIKAINEAKWLDVETRNNASHKVMSAKTNIGYPDFYRNDNEITEIFRDLQIGESTYLHNVWKIHRFNAALTLRGTGNKDEHFATWIPVLASTTSSTAFYYALENVIVVSPNRLQRPTIDKTQPSYMNYGRIGFVIGHELGHVFDTLRNSISKDKITKDLLIKTSAENLNKRVDCIMDQYNNYTFEDTNNIVNVRLPHRENIADNVGVKMIYYAYKDWSSLHDPEPTLPGLNYTSSQMFWISLASLRCTGRRTPNQYRIIGILSNIPEFSKDFNCPLGSPMNPTKKCTIL